GKAIAKSLGAVPGDLRNLTERRQRHRLVSGSSGFAGYELGPEARGEIELTTVGGEPIPLPISDDLVPVVDQNALTDWTLSQNPKRGQWAPGVTALDRPSWHPRRDAEAIL
ncbi:MAG: hypothetical protein WCJ48_05580, partial [Actinomycetes bacterium]